MATSTEMVKVYTRRDSATAALKKLGIKAADYNKFITQTDGKVECQLGKAREYLSPPAKHQPRTTQSAKQSVASVVRGLVAAGKTNAEIWEVIKPQFNLGDDKRHYPGWYRNQQLRNKRDGR